MFGTDPSTILRTYGASREEVRLALEEDIEARPVWKPERQRLEARKREKIRRLEGKRMTTRTFVYVMFHSNNSL